MKNVERWRRITLLCILHSAFCILRSFANELTVDKRTMQLDDSLTITVTLDNGFANLDTLRLPLQNLTVDGPPSVSSEFQWINGESSRRKVFRYTAHPNAPGGALVGPLVLHGGGAQVETLAPISIQILPDATAGSNDPVRILREMLATNREPIFIVADMDKSEVYAGEEAVVTWTLYNATSVQQYAINDIPKLEDFWTEELDIRNEQPQQMMLGGVGVQKLAVRRAALFPLRSGSLTIPPMSISASIMRRIRVGDPFGLFEGMVVDVHRRSSPLTLRARPIPPGSPVSAVGDVALRCGSPLQRNGGPVAIDVALAGRANLRAAMAPQWEGRIDGSVQIVEGTLSVERGRDDATMTRRWRYLVFPAHQGAFTIPALAATILTPTGARQQLRCEAKTLNVAASAPAEAPPRLAAMHRRRSVVRILPWAAGTVVMAMVLMLMLPRIRRSRSIRTQVRNLVRPTPSETRAAVDEYLAGRGIDPAQLIREPSDRGDAYRSLRSLLDAQDRDRIPATRRDVAHRVRDLVTA